MPEPTSAPLVVPTAAGLYCPAGDFHVDPWRPVERAVITHGHSDHARLGHARYWAARPGLGILRKRLGDVDVVPVEYGEPLAFGRARVSFHPAGHVLGSAQIRIEADRATWVISGDYKREPDPTCAPFEVVACDTFVSEATFALPIYRWRPTAEVVDEIREWWLANRRAGVASVLGCYALGKAQRVLAELLRVTDEPVYVHGAVATLTDVYREAGVAMVPTLPVSAARKDYAGELIVAPPGADATPWMRRFGKASTGFCSGWMRVRGNRRRRGYDRGFVLSDHADWPSLLRTIRETRARRALLTHGHSDVLVRYLREQGVEAGALETAFAGEDGGTDTPATAGGPPLGAVGAPTDANAPAVPERAREA
ncbi:MAG: ligase-associated DNA damage response exonuclease [Steroidobacteraceae bacterium]|jgi:putative mRNA 3-end processing factor|nr:ligase-associated DNA damage response exonuclease [Steroidobacteraceae bacterium]